VDVVVIYIIIIKISKIRKPGRSSSNLDEYTGCQHRNISNNIWIDTNHLSSVSSKILIPNDTSTSVGGSYFILDSNKVDVLFSSNVSNVYKKRKSGLKFDIGFPQ